MAAKKILAIKLRSLGDTVLLTASLRALHHAFPQAEIHSLVPEEWAPLLENLPGISQVWAYTKPQKFLPMTCSLFQLATRLRKEKYDSVLNFHASPRSAFLARATGAPQRSIHFHGHTHPNRFSTLNVPGKGILKPIIERDLDTVRALGLSIPQGFLPQIQLTSEEIQKADSFIQGLPFKSPKPAKPSWLGLSLGASRPTKQWPLENFADLAKTWCAKTGGGVLAFAGPSEAHLISRFQELTKGASNAVFALNHFSIRELAAILSKLAVLAGNDSGPKHLAISVGTPTVTLFGPEHPFEWHPYSPTNHPYLFIEELSCRRDAAVGMPAWCGLNECSIEKHKCMHLISSQKVLDLCEKVARI